MIKETNEKRLIRIGTRLALPVSIISVFSIVLVFASLSLTVQKAFSQVQQQQPSSQQQNMTKIPAGMSNKTAAGAIMSMTPQSMTSGVTRMTNMNMMNMMMNMMNMMMNMPMTSVNAGAMNMTGLMPQSQGSNMNGMM